MGIRLAEDSGFICGSLSLVPSPLVGRAREGGKSQTPEFVISPSLALPHKGGENRSRSLRE
jgi:hypothetical protein